MSSVATEWGHRLSSDEKRYPASEIYGGRAFQEALTSARMLEARLLVISAGLGLIDASSAIPPYACTVLVGAPDSVADRITDHFSLSAWWAALRSASPYSEPLTSFIADDTGPILAALSDAYLSMVADEIASLPDPVLTRLRLFTRAPTTRIPTNLRCYVMPYDDRLDGPDSHIRGTRSDFAARALRHFVGLQPTNSLVDDAKAVNAALFDWRLPSKVGRDRKSDGDLISLMRRHWDAVDGSSSRLLRLFRDDLGIACEQSRFAALARQVREERA